MSKTLLAVALLALLQGCALYRLQVTTPDGKTVKGTALIANDSDRVELRVKNGDFEARFTKVGTAGETQADVVTETVDAVTGPL